MGSVSASPLRPCCQPPVCVPPLTASLLDFFTPLFTLSGGACWLKAFNRCGWISLSMSGCACAIKRATKTKTPIAVDPLRQLIGSINWNPLTSVAACLSSICLVLCLKLFWWIVYSGPSQPSGLYTHRYYGKVWILQQNIFWIPRGLIFLPLLSWK